MTPYKQLLRHDPANGVYGDCFRTAIACLLDLAPADVPHAQDLLDGDVATQLMRDWLEDRGLYLLTLPITPHDEDLEGVLSTVGHLNQGLHYLLGGRSTTGVGHYVVCRGGEIVHNPARDDAPIVAPMEDGYYWLAWLVKRL